MNSRLHQLFSSAETDTQPVWVNPPRGRTAADGTHQAAADVWNVQLFGSAGNGKTAVLASLLATIRHHRRDVLIERINTYLDGQFMKLVYDHVETERTDSGQAETLMIRTPHLTALLSARPAEENRPDNNSVNLKPLTDQIEWQGVDLLGLCVNPFQHDPHLATWAFVEMIWWLNNHKSSLRFGQCVELAARLLWNLTSDGLARLRTGWQKIPTNVLNEARLVRQPGARFGQDVAAAFQIEGAPPETAQRLLVTLTRQAQTMATHDNDWHIVVELARRFPQSSLVIVTRADLLAYLPGLSRGDLRDFGASIFSRPEAARLSQVVVQGSLDLVIRDDPDDPVWIKGPSTDAADLLTAVERELLAAASRGQLRRAKTIAVRDNRPFWIVASLLLPPLLILLVLHPPTTLVVCGLFLVAWLLAFCAWHLFWTMPREHSPQSAAPRPMAATNPPPERAREVVIDRPDSSNGQAVANTAR